MAPLQPDHGARRVSCQVTGHPEVEFTEDGRSCEGSEEKIHQYRHSLESGYSPATWEWHQAMAKHQPSTAIKSSEFTLTMATVGHF
eukprot:Skav213329  [mRNA]  locus=scaffold3340:250438:251375:+ [translate_table: standard]